MQNQNAHCVHAEKTVFACEEESVLVLAHAHVHIHVHVRVHVHVCLPLGVSLNQSRGGGVHCWYEKAFPI